MRLTTFVPTVRRNQMKKSKKISLTVIGGLVSLLIAGGITFVGGFFFLLNKGYFPIPETKDFILLYSSCLGIVAGVLGFHFLLRKRYKYFARGILAGFLIVIPIIYDTTVDLIWYLTPEPFDSEVWQSNVDKPLEMVFSLIRDDTDLIGKTKAEAIELLGKDIIEEYSNDSTLTYHIDYGRISFFRVAINGSGTVERVYYVYFD